MLGRAATPKKEPDREGPARLEGDKDLGEKILVSSIVQ
jgi:hypothetical protein